MTRFACLLPPICAPALLFPFVPLSCSFFFPNAWITLTAGKPFEHLDNTFARQDNSKPLALTSPPPYGVLTTSTRSSTMKQEAVI